MSNVTEIRDESNTVEFYEHDALVQRMHVSRGTMHELVKVYSETAAYVSWYGNLTKIYLADTRMAA